MSADTATGARQRTGGGDAIVNGAVQGGSRSGLQVPVPVDTTVNGPLDKECEQLTSNINAGGDAAQPAGRSNGIVVTPPLPKGCVPLSHQVAGHVYGKGSSKAGLLQDGMGSVLKPAQNACRGKTERTFYQNITRLDQSDPLFTSLRPFVPRFYGTFISPEDPSLVYLKINDITSRFRKPCVMDVKIGCKSYEDGVPLRKVQLAREKYPNLEKIGFQILGMRVYHPATDEFECRDKFYGRSLHGDNVIEGFARYLNVVDSIRTDVISEFINQMKRIERWFVGQKQLHFYSSSLLFVYEGAVSPTIPSPLVTTLPSTTPAENDDLGGAAPPNFVSYSQLRRVGPKSKTSNNQESLPTTVSDFSEPLENSAVENGFVNRLPTYQESIAAKVGHCLVPGQAEVISSPAKGAISEQRENEPQLLDINGRLTVSQMRERQRSLSQSNTQPDWPPHQDTDSKQPITAPDSNKTSFKPVEVEETPTVQQQDQTDSDNKLSVIKMIDFTHVVEADGLDESYLFGLRNVIRFFEMLKKTYCKK